MCLLLMSCSNQQFSSVMLLRNRFDRMHFNPPIYVHDTATYACLFVLDLNENVERLEFHDEASNSTKRIHDSERNLYTS
jgi:hypothetical protein